jgi:hypothetical protein
VFDTIIDDIRSEISANKVNAELAAFIDDEKYTVTKNLKVFSKISVIR